MTDEKWTIAVLCEEYQPEPAVTVSEWADKHRVLSSKASAEPGPWRTSRTPYLREIMDSLSSYSSIVSVAVMKGAQIGMSEAGMNFCGYIIHHAPGPALYVMPTVETLKRISKTRLDPMIDASPALSERIPNARSKDASNTMFSKEFMGGVLILTGANSASGLRSMPIRFLILDEVDAYPANVDKEGDPVNLAIKRTSTFLRRKIFMLSTPGTKGESRIGEAFREGDQRYFNIACDECGVMQPFKWKQIKWPEGKPHLACFHCEHCDHPHPEHRKLSLMDNGEWIATAEPKKPGVRSYHISSLYSPWQTWGECAQEFISCHGPDGKSDSAKLQVFVNTVLGEEWEDMTGERVDAEGLLGLREDWGPVLPDKVALLTFGADVQNDRIEVEVVGYGRDEESWSIDTQVFIGDPSQKDVWDRLEEYLKRPWPHRGYPQTGMPIQAGCIDTGGSHTASVYAWAHSHTARKWWAIKGSNEYRSPIWPRRPSRTKKSGTNFYMVGVSAAKDIIHRRLSRTGPKESGPGACHFGMDWDQERFNQLTVEVKKVKYVNGFRVPFWWKPDGARNEALDCRVYSYAALQSLAAMGVKLNTQAQIVAEKVDAALKEGQIVGIQRPKTMPDVQAPTEPTVDVPVKPARVAAKRRRVTSSSFMDG